MQVLRLVVLNRVACRLGPLLPPWAGALKHFLPPEPSYTLVVLAGPPAPAGASPCASPSGCAEPRFPGRDAGAWSAPR